MNEIEAVAAIKVGDRNAFEYLFTMYYNRLVAYITTYTNDKANSEDIVQQAFISLWENKCNLDESKSPKGYLYSIAYNRYIDTVKSKKRQEKLISQIWERALMDRIEEDSEAMEHRIKKMKLVIESLPPKCREIILLNKIHGIKYKEIADKLGISVKTVESQMRIAFTKIRETYKKEGLLYFLYFK